MVKLNDKQIEDAEGWEKQGTLGASDADVKRRFHKWEDFKRSRKQKQEKGEWKTTGEEKTPST